jgi:hypothetical protein
MRGIHRREDGSVDGHRSFFALLGVQWYRDRVGIRRERGKQGKSGAEGVLQIATETKEKETEIKI